MCWNETTQSPWSPWRWERPSHKNAPEACPLVGGDFWLKEGVGKKAWNSLFFFGPPQNMFGMWKPMVFLAIAAVALYVLPNMRPQESEYYMKWWQTSTSPEGRSPEATTLTFGQNTCARAPNPPMFLHLLCLSHSDWKGLWELLALNLLPCVRTWVPCN